MNPRGWEKRFLFKTTPILYHKLLQICQFSTKNLIGHQLWNVSNFGYKFKINFHVVFSIISNIPQLVSIEFFKSAYQDIVY